MRYDPQASIWDLLRILPDFRHHKLSLEIIYAIYHVDLKRMTTENSCWFWIKDLWEMLRMLRTNAIKILVVNPWYLPREDLRS